MSQPMPPAEVAQLCKQLHALIHVAKRPMSDDDVMPLARRLMEQVDNIAEQLELAVRMEHALLSMLDAGLLKADWTEYEKQERAKADARNAVDDVLLASLFTRDERQQQGLIAQA